MNPGASVNLFLFKILMYIPLLLYNNFNDSPFPVRDFSKYIQKKILESNMCIADFPV